jgi:hypothetical protein
MNVGIVWIFLDKLPVAVTIRISWRTMYGGEHDGNCQFAVHTHA